MNAYLNYMVEATTGLMLLLVIYKLLLHRETNFSVVRRVLLLGIIMALLLPLLHFENTSASSPMGLGQVVPANWLPEVVIGEVGFPAPNETSFNFWKYVSLIYMTGFAFSFLLVIFQLVQLFRVIAKAQTYRVQKLRIAESEEDIPVFSFFNFIFIGKAHDLLRNEKQQIIQHESVHASQWHSFDILLISLLKIIFWFNPFIHLYKKIFIQLHEFEADARAVENTDVNKYCDLLAKVALKSAGFTLANHFNNSLTVKRIEMMRTIKNKIQPWKFALMAMMIPVAFFLFACHDQFGSAGEGNTEVFAAMDEHAYPKGGFENFYNDLRRNITYPATSRRDHKYGKVLVQFIVNEDGRLSDLTLLDSPDVALGEEAMRVLSLQSEWIPAKKSGAAVKERMIFPVHFKLDFPGKGTVAMENDLSAPESKPSLEEIVVVGYVN